MIKTKPSRAESLIGKLDRLIKKLEKLEKKDRVEQVEAAQKQLWKEVEFTQGWCGTMMQENKRIVAGLESLIIDLRNRIVELSDRVGK